MSGPYGRLLDADAIRAGDHRRMIGGMWDSVGRLQFEHVVATGLLPGMRLLDLGCGALRGGVHFVRYLEPGHYFGLDLNASLLDAGYDVELAACGLQDKLPRHHLIADGDFRVERFGTTFDVVLAHSVATHLPGTEVARLLAAVARVLTPTGRCFLTFFECPDDCDPMPPRTHEPGGITTHPDRNPWHHRPSDLAALGRAASLRVVSCGEWGHPRAQRMLCLEPDERA